MQTLTAMTLGALMLGTAAFIYDAAAQSSSCSHREASIYFEKDKTEINDFSKAVVERMASEAKACGIDTVVADAKVADDKRAAALANAFQSQGVKIVVAEPPKIQPEANSFIAHRAARIRLRMSRDVS